MPDFTILPSGIKILSTTPVNSGGIVLNQNYTLTDTHIQSTTAHGLAAYLKLDGSRAMTGNLNIGGSITFADSTTQNTAYQGIPGLAIILGNDNDAGGRTIANVGNVVFSDSTTQSTAYTGVPTLGAVMSLSGDAGGNGLYNVGGVSSHGDFELNNNSIRDVYSIAITGALADGTYACGTGSITITNGAISAITA